MNRFGVAMVAAGAVGAGAAAIAWIALLSWNLPPEATDGDFGATRMVAVLAAAVVVAAAIGWRSGSTALAAAAAGSGAVAWTAIMCWRLVAVDGLDEVNLLGVTIVLFNIPLGVASVLLASAIGRRSTR